VSILRDVLMVTGLVWWICVAGLVLLIAGGMAYSAARDEDLSELVVGDLVVGRDEFGNEVCFPRTTGPGASSTQEDGRTLGLVAPLSDPAPRPVANAHTGSGSTPKVSRPPGH
jgi:hypothetical protein